MARRGPPAGRRRPLTCSSGGPAAPARPRPLTSRSRRPRRSRGAGGRGAARGSDQGGQAEAEETFGARLRRLRERADLSQEQLADRAGLNRYSVIKWERDQHEPMWSSVLALARALGRTVADFDGTEAPPPDVRPARKGRPRKAPPAAEHAPAPPAEEETRPGRKKGGEG